MSYKSKRRRQKRNYHERRELGYSAEEAKRMSGRSVEWWEVEDAMKGKFNKVGCY